MIWVTLILGIIQALPSIIALVQEILQALNDKPLGTRLKAEHELQRALLDWHHGGGDEALLKSLHALGQSLGCPSAKPAL